MKIYLDDIRNDIRNPKTDGWTIVRDANSAIDIILTHWNEIDEISLDHDLGDENLVGNGYDVVLKIEEYVYNNHPSHIPDINVHSANSVASIRMRSAIDAIKKKFYSV